MAARSNYEFVQQILQSPGVRRKLAEVADRKARQAVAVAASERVAVPVLREDGTRPKGRPYSRISIPADYEHGTSRVQRLRILGRVVGL
jgi:hypothetical protein